MLLSLEVLMRIRKCFHIYSIFTQCFLFASCRGLLGIEIPSLRRLLRINDRDTLWSIYVNAEGVSDELLESGLEAHEIAEMERVNNTEHIVAFEDYDPAIAALERRAVDAREDGLRWDAKVFSKRAEDLKAAKKTASICGAFTNVDDSTNATLHRNKSSKALYREQFQTKET